MRSPEFEPGITSDDNPILLMSIAMKLLAIPPFPLSHIITTSDNRSKRGFTFLVLAGISTEVALSVLGIVFLEPIIRVLGADDTAFSLYHDYAFMILFLLPLAIHPDADVVFFHHGG